VGHVLIRREASGGFLRPHEAVVDGDLENPAAGPAQVDLSIGMGFQNQLPRRDRPRLIASHSAVFYFDPHLRASFGRIFEHAFN
jgi:hypothetical protein